MQRTVVPVLVAAVVSQATGAVLFYLPGPPDPNADLTDWQRVGAFLFLYTPVALLAWFLLVAAVRAVQGLRKHPDA